MLCLCLYVPVLDTVEGKFEYFESGQLPAELKSLFKLSLFIPSHELITYRRWRKVNLNSILDWLLLKNFNNDFGASLNG